MTAFDPRGTREIERFRTSAATEAPRTFTRQDEFTGDFFESSIPTSKSYWGVLIGSKRVVSDIVEPGNIPTWFANRAADLFGSNKRFVKQGTAAQMRLSTFGATGRTKEEDKTQEISLWRYLSNRWSPIQEVSAIDAKLAIIDEDFDGKQAVQDLIKFSPEIAISLERNGRDLRMLEVASNEHEFKAILDGERAHIAAIQSIDQYNSEVGAFKNISNKILSGVFNYMATDPTFVPSLFVGVGGLSMAANSVKASAGILRVGARVAKAGQGIILHAPFATPKAVAPLLFRGTAKAVTMVGSAPKAAHGALAARWGTAAATSVELGSFGMAFNAVQQQERNDQWNQIFEGSEWQREFSWSELALTGLIGGALGYTLGRITQATTTSAGSVARTRKAMIEATGGDGESIVARNGFIDGRSVKAQAHEDKQVLRIHELVTRIVGEGGEDLGLLVNRELLTDSGLMIDDAVQILESISVALQGDMVDSLPILRLAQELFTQAKAARTVGTVNDAVGDMLMRQAYNKALIQVVEEGVDQSNSAAVRARIDEIIDDHLEFLRKAPTEKPIGMRADMNTEELEQFIQGMDSIALTRSLTELEESQMLWAAKSLEFATGKSTVSKLAPRFDVSDFTPSSAFGKVVVAIHKERMELARLKGLPNTRKAQKAVQKRINKLLTQAREVFPSEVRPRLSAEDKLLIEVRAAKAKSPADRARAMKEYTETIGELDEGVSLELGNSTVVSTIMKAFGLGDYASRLATQKTGIYQTVRSVHAGIRQLAEVFDTSRHTVESIRLNARNYVGNLRQRHDANDRLLIPMLDFMGNLHDRKFFGGFRDTLSGQKAQRQAKFEREVYMDLHNVEAATTPEAQELSRMLRPLYDKFAKEGLANGTMKEVLPDFVPHRASIGVVMRDRVKFREELTKHYTAQWLESQEVHLDTLVTMGLAERVALPGNQLKWTLKGELAHLADGPIETLQRTALGEFDAKYITGLTDAVDDQGLTGMGASMRRAVANLTDERNFIEESGRIVMRETVGPSSKIERKFDATVLANPNLEPFFRTDIVSLTADYVRHAGLDIKANSLVQEITGIKGLVFTEYLDGMEKHLSRLAKEGTDEAKQIRIGINVLREKWLKMSGREQTLLAQTEGFEEFLSETAKAGTLAIYGALIGNAVFTTEVVVSLATRGVTGKVFARKVKESMLALNPKTHNATFKRNAGYLGFSTRLYQNHNATRFIGGSVSSDFQYGTLDRILAPWRDVWDNVSGKTATGPRNMFGKAQIVPQVVGAIGRNNLVMGGSNMFTRIAQINTMVGLHGETARFLPAALKLVGLMEDNADKLAAANTAARKAFKGLDGKARAAAGNNAELKVWKGLAREAGFGSNVDVAERFGQFQMLDRNVLELIIEAGEATGSLKTKGKLPMMDPIKMAEYIDTINPTRANALQDALNRMYDSFEDVVSRRVSEQRILQTPTSEASRSHYGRMINTMTSFSRSFFDNNILDLAQMPTHKAVALSASFVLGETLNRISRRIYNGEDFDVIMDEFEDNPVATMLNYSLNVPLLGQYNFVLRSVMDPILNDTSYKQEFNQGAAVSVANELLNFTSQSIRAPFSEEAREGLGHSAEKYARRLTPGLNSHFGGIALFALDEAAGIDLRLNAGKRSKRGTDFDFTFTDQPEPELGEITDPLTKLLEQKEGN